MVCFLWMVLLLHLDKICDLADKYDALVMIDECHAAGFIGKTGRGTLKKKVLWVELILLQEP